MLPTLTENLHSCLSGCTARCPSLVHHIFGLRVFCLCVGVNKLTKMDCSCNRSHCAQCKWRRLKTKWGVRLQKMEDGRSWLSATREPFGIGCRACSQYCQKQSLGGTAWSRYEVSSTTALQVSSFLQHEKSDMHILAMSTNLAQSKPNKALAPSEAEFKQALQGRLERRSLRNLASSAMGRHKAKKIQFCLAEAARQMHRKRLAKCMAIALHQDARGKTLLTRFSGCGRDLKLVRGTIPVGKGGKHDARSLAALTRQSLEDFCTPFLGAPGVLPA